MERTKLKEICKSAQWPLNDERHKLIMGDSTSRQVLDRGMYYQSGVRYPEIGLTGMKSDDDALDLCVRKQDKEDSKDKFAGDVNGNGFAENSNRFYKHDLQCKSPEMLMQQQRFVQPVLTPPDADSCPTPVNLQEKIYQDERVQSSPNSLSPSNSQPFVTDSLASHFLSLPTTISAITARNGKPTRPFKAYPKDFLTLATSEGLLDDSSKRYMEFRRQFLTQLHASTGLTSNKNMKRPVQSDSPNQLPSSSGDAKDQAYWERRKKNNEAAKKSRDARRAKEDEIAIRAAFLERENVRLKLELASLRSETDRLRCMLYTS